MKKTMPRAQAEELLRGPELSPTPCGPFSPGDRRARNGGLILMIGVGTAANLSKQGISSRRGIRRSAFITSTHWWRRS